MMANGCSLMARRITATEVGGSDWVSITNVSRLRPRMPPFLLISSAPRMTPSRNIVPEGAPPPVISATMASLTGPWAEAGGARASAASRAAPSANRNRCLRMMSSWAREGLRSVGIEGLTGP